MAAPSGFIWKVRSGRAVRPSRAIAASSAAGSAMRRDRPGLWVRQKRSPACSSVARAAASRSSSSLSFHSNRMYFHSTAGRVGWSRRARIRSSAAASLPPTR